MAFKASNIVPDKGYEIAKARAWKVRQWSSQYAGLLNSDISGQTLIQILNGLASHKSELEQVKTTPGIAAYAREQESDPAYDVAAEFVALLSLIDDAISTIQAVNVNLLITDWTLDGVVWQNFTPAQTAALKADLNAIVAQVS